MKNMRVKFVLVPFFMACSVIAKADEAIVKRNFNVDEQHFVTLTAPEDWSLVQEPSEYKGKPILSIRIAVHSLLSSSNWIWHFGLRSTK